jgi:hypothetical protein
MNDYHYEAFNETAKDAARVGMEDMVMDAYNDGDITEEKLFIAMANIAENPFTAFKDLYEAPVGFVYESTFDNGSE